MWLRSLVSSSATRAAAAVVAAAAIIVGAVTVAVVVAAAVAAAVNVAVAVGSALAADADVDVADADAVVGSLVVVAAAVAVVVAAIAVVVVAVVVVVVVVAAANVAAVVAGVIVVAVAVAVAVAAAASATRPTAACVALADLLAWSRVSRHVVTPSHHKDHAGSWQVFTATTTIAATSVMAAAEHAQHEAPHQSQPLGRSQQPQQLQEQEPVCPCEKTCPHTPGPGVGPTLCMPACEVPRWRLLAGGSL